MLLLKVWLNGSISESNPILLVQALSTLTLSILGLISKGIALYNNYSYTLSLFSILIFPVMIDSSDCYNNSIVTISLELYL